MALRIRPRRAAVDSHDTAALRRIAHRTTAVRLVLVTAIVALLAAAAASARTLDVRERGLLPRDSTGVVVLDLSLSIDEKNYADVRRAMRRLIKADALVGLVIFSDVPYELFPPGTPASELRPLLRLLQPPGTGAPVNPWWQTFRAGTRISSALALAQEMLERDRIRNGSILLVTDLETAPEDVPALTRKLEELKRDGIEVRVIPLSASSDGIAVVTEVLGRDAFAAPPDAPAGDPRRTGGDAVSELPTTLLVLGAILFGILAVHEGFAGRLALPRPGRAPAASRGSEA